MPMAEPFLSNQDVIAQYLPGYASVESFDFDSCSGSNCFDFSPESENPYVVLSSLS